MHLQQFAVGAEWNTLGRGVDPRHPVPTVRETDVGRPSGARQDLMAFARSDEKGK
jgi:hypothetical protein